MPIFDPAQAGEKSPSGRGSSRLLNRVKRPLHARTQSAKVITIMVQALFSGAAGTVAKHYEFIGFAPGSESAELICVTDSPDWLRDTLSKDPFTSKQNWAGFERFAIIKPGQTRPSDVVQTKQTIRGFLGFELERFISNWVETHDAATMTPKKFLEHYGYHKDAANAGQRTYGVDAWTWPSLTIELDPNGFRNFTSDLQADDEAALLFSSKAAPRDAASAWWAFDLDDWDSESVSFFVGPGTGSLTLPEPAFHPQQYAVWSVDGSKAIFLGYRSRENAKHVAHQILAVGASPVVASPYLPGNHDWDDTPRTSHLDPVAETQPQLVSREDAGGES